MISNFPAECSVSFLKYLLIFKEILIQALKRNEWDTGQQQDSLKKLDFILVRTKNIWERWLKMKLNLSFDQVELINP